jgi:polar amino acid transport system substrate-binding protein
MALTTGKKSGDGKMAKKSKLVRIEHSMRYCIVFLISAFFISMFPMTKLARAQTCGYDYVLREGDSLADIAANVYGSSSQWTLIFYANQDRLGSNTSLLQPGVSIRVPCLGEQSPANAALPVPPAASSPSPLTEEMELSPSFKQFELLTADGFAPFSDRALSHGGMVTQIVTSAMDLIKERSNGNFNYNVSWVNDWTAHLNPLLVTKAFDAGFPWTKPDCSHVSELSQDARYRCQRFFFSDPVFEVLTILFVRSNSPITFAKDDDILGKSVCQAANQTTYEFDKGGRNWAKNKKIVVLRPATLEECFKLLASGSADAVAAPDLAGTATVSALRLGDKVKSLPRPVAVVTLHVIVPKTHPQASLILYYLNTTIAKLHENGDYDRITDSHLSQFWAAAEKK